MGRTVIILPDDLEAEFRNEVYRRLGMRKGSITKAIIEAIKLWLGHEDERILTIVGRYKSGDELSLDDFKAIMEYCRSLGRRCSGCVLYKKFGKCPVVVSVR